MFEALIIFIDGVQNRCVMSDLRFQQRKQGLGIWCATQRETYKFEKASMPKERIEALDALGFTWSRWGHQRSKARKDAWEKRFDELVEYKNVSSVFVSTVHFSCDLHLKYLVISIIDEIKANGDCNISQYDENNKQLGKWAKNQRYEYRRYNNKGLGQSRISRDRIDKLESIGFQWRLKPEKISWDQRFEVRARNIVLLLLTPDVFSNCDFSSLAYSGGEKALKKYKEEYGHCRPPQNYPEIGTVSHWYPNLNLVSTIFYSLTAKIIVFSFRSVGQISTQSIAILLRRKAIQSLARKGGQTPLRWIQ